MTNETRRAGLASVLVSQFERRAVILCFPYSFDSLLSHPHFRHAAWPIASPAAISSYRTGWRRATCWDGLVGGGYEGCMYNVWSTSLLVYCGVLRSCSWFLFLFLCDCSTTGREATDKGGVCFRGAAGKGAPSPKGEQAIKRSNKK